MKRITEIFDQVATGVTALAAVVVALAFVRRDAAPSSSMSERSTPATPQIVDDWKQIIPNGVLIGRPDARILLVAFSDLQCPFCRRFHNTVKALQATHGDEFAFLFVHFPLPMHRFARIAARAAECADRQGLLAGFLDVAYAKQDSIGLKSWSSLGQEAGVRDTSEFVRCVSGTQPLARIDSGLAVGERFAVDGTPTVILNGWRFPTPPGEEELRRVIEDLLGGREPFRPSARGAG